MHDILEECRAVYPGPICYGDQIPPSGSNPTPNWAKITLWNDVDIIGCGASNRNLARNSQPTYEEVRASLSRYQEEVVVPLRGIADKPLLFMENSVQSMDGILAYFLDYVRGTLDAPVDLREQALYFEAVSDIVADEEWFFGHGWYGTSWIPALRGSVTDRGIMVFGKPAGEVVRQTYCGSCNQVDTPILDGAMDEWDSFLIAENVARDSHPADKDLLRIYAVRDGQYLYYAVEISNPIARDESIVFELDLDEDSRPDTAVHIWYTGNEAWGRWSSSLPKDMTYSKSLGFTDVQPATDLTGFEGRVPLRMLGFPNTIQLRVRFERLAVPTKYDSINYWISVP
jgi:hypothetical protein